jgi:hypothetical protein
MPDQGEMLSALILVVMALFIASGQPFAGRWRRTMRLAAMIAFALAVVAALIEVGWWLAASGSSAPILR